LNTLKNVGFLMLFLQKRTKNLVQKAKENTLYRKRFLLYSQIMMRRQI